MFVTEDMTLVAILKTKGIECSEMINQHGGCRWMFRPNDVIDQTLDEYNADECLVEPREFVKKLSLVRQDMYSFLGHAPKRVRSAT